MRQPCRAKPGARAGSANHSAPPRGTAACRKAAVGAALVGSSIGSPLSAQTSATLGTSVSIVEYEGFLVSGAGTLTPAIRFESPTLALGAQAGWTIFESGNQVLQATTAASWLGTLHPRWRLELAGVGGASKYADEPGSAHALASGRLHLVSSRGGVWAGATTGAISGDSELDGGPVELETGAWAVHDRLTLVGTVTAAWLGGDRHVDLLGAVRWTAGRVELETRLSARPWTRSEEEVGDAIPGVFAEASALVSLSPRVALAIGAGSYPSDPVRRALAARYVTAGVRVATPSRRIEPPRLSGAALAAVRERLARPATAAITPSLEIAGAGEMRTLRVLAPGARTVEVMADFTDWQPVAMSSSGGGLWELRLAVPSGTHRLNIRVDAGEWIVPAGARPEAGEFGGVVGVVVVR